MRSEPAPSARLAAAVAARGRRTARLRRGALPRLARRALADLDAAAQRVHQIDHPRRLALRPRSIGLPDCFLLISSRSAAS